NKRASPVNTRKRRSGGFRVIGGGGHENVVIRRARRLAHGETPAPHLLRRSFRSVEMLVRRTARPLRRTGTPVGDDQSPVSSKHATHLGQRLLAAYLVQQVDRQDSRYRPILDRHPIRRDQQRLDDG